MCLLWTRRQLQISQLKTIPFQLQQCVTMASEIGLLLKYMMVYYREPIRFN